MILAAKLTLLFTGIFFLTGLITGIWKYAHIARSEDATAPAYVDIAHRASLLYSFAALVIFKFVELSPYSPGWTLIFALGPQVFFALAIGTYVIHGLLNDTDNQLRRPHRLGRQTLPPGLIMAFMGCLIVAEVGGFAVLLYGVLTV